MENLISETEIQDNEKDSIKLPYDSNGIEIKPTLRQRFFACNPIHNRINRSGFFLNIVFFGIICYGLYYFLKGTIVSGIASIILILVFSYIYYIQIKKRCHDFGNSGNIIIFFMFLITLSPIWIQYIYYLLPSGVFGYINFMFQYGIYIMLSTIILWIILTLIPGDCEENKYGKSYLF